MNRLTAATAAALLTAVLAHPASASAASNSATTSIPVDPATQIEMHVTANCVARDRCSFNTTANLLTPDGPTGFPGDAWARQTITLRSTTAMCGRKPIQRTVRHAPGDQGRESRQRAVEDVQVPERRRDLRDHLRRWTDRALSGRRRLGAHRLEHRPPNTRANFIACSHIQVVYGGVNLTTPTACAQTTFS